MIELYFAPGACSFVPHVGLEAIKAVTGEDFKPNLVKLHKGGTLPSYVSARAEIGTDMFTAEIRAGDLPRLEDDPVAPAVVGRIEEGAHRRRHGHM